MLDGEKTPRLILILDGMQFYYHNQLDFCSYSLYITCLYIKIPLYNSMNSYNDMDTISDTSQFCILFHKTSIKMKNLFSLKQCSLFFNSRNSNVCENNPD